MRKKNNSSKHSVKALDSLGFDHILLPILVVVVVAAIGACALVVSHAATPNKHVVAMQNAASTDGCKGAPTLQQGSHGSCVKWAQTIMYYNDPEYFSHQWHYLPTVPSRSGQFGYYTKHDVMKEQQWCKIPIDGVIGPKTWTCLEELPAIPPG